MDKDTEIQTILDKVAELQTRLDIVGQHCPDWRELYEIRTELGNIAEMLQK